MRIFALLLCLLMLPAALAEEFTPYEMFTFSASLPEKLAEPLSALIPDVSAVLSGAAIQYNGYSTDDTPCYSAVMLVQSDAGLRLYAAAQPEDQPWQICDYTRFLRSADFCSISVCQPKPTYQHVPRFSIDYYAPDAQCSDTLAFWHNRLWKLLGHTNQSTGSSISTGYELLGFTNQSTGVCISTGYDTLTFSCAPVRQEYLCSEPFFMDYMAGIADFPTTKAALEKLAVQRVSFFHTSAGDFVYTIGANLRAEPTTHSDSLGAYYANVPMVYTGQQKQGSAWPWYQVRIGSTIGWMSGNYTAPQLDMGCSPVPLGRTRNNCPLYADADGRQTIAQLEPGSTFHILTETSSMYHICIPRGDISWAVDAQGTYGYIPKANVLTGASLSALDAQSPQ